MALRGTLGDFGIADIFQLVGHQSKTGVLRLKNREFEVRISFVDGNVVKAEQSTRHSRELLGNIMVRADVITEEQLEQALEMQTRTLKRLGDILVELGFVEMQTLRELARLQTTETIYRLFSWEAGTYEFSAGEVEWDKSTQEAIRADNILMEGFRMVDEWPNVRAVVPHNDLSFTQLKPLPAEADAGAGASAGGGDEDFDLDAAFDFGDDKAAKVEQDPHVGAAERLVYNLVTPGRPVVVIIAKSRLGEFDTCKALAHLVRGGYLAPEGKKKTRTAIRASTGSQQSGLRDALVPIATRLLLYLVVAACAGGMIKLLSSKDSGLLASSRPQVVSRGAVQAALGGVQRSRIERLVERRRLISGSYPTGLGELTREGLASSEISFPYRTPYAYRRIPADPETGRGPSFVVGLPLR